MGGGVYSLEEIFEEHLLARPRWTLTNVTTLHLCNARGETAYTAIDSNRNDTVDFAGLDRLTQTTNDVVANYGTNVLRTYVWGTNGVNVPTLSSGREVSVEGLKM